MNCASCTQVIPQGAVYCPYCGHPVDGADECHDYAYEAFISYRHLPHDKKIAQQIQRRIEGFRIPRALRTPDGPKRLGKLFRDEDELPTSTSLPDQISDALKHARFLFVICSRDTPRSSWVEQEVFNFASYHGRDRIRLVLIEGEPSESFPPLLLHRWQLVDGTPVKVPTEPLAANLQDDSRRRLNTECLRLIAPLIGCGFDDLRNRQRQRTLRIAASAAALVTTVSTSFGAFSLYQQHQIEHNYHATQIRESELLAAQAEELAANGDRYQAINVALAALPASPTSSDRPLVPAARIALEESLDIYSRHPYWHASFSVSNLSPSTEAYALSDSELLAYASIDDAVRVVELKTGDEVMRIDLAHDLDAASSSLQSMTFVNDSLVCLTDTAVGCYNVRTGKLAWRHDAQGEQHNYLTLGKPDGSAVAILSKDINNYLKATLTLVDVQSGKPTNSYDISLPLNSSRSVKAVFNKRGTHLALGENDTCILVNLKNGNIAQTTLPSETQAGLSYAIEELSWIDGKLYVGMHSWQVLDQYERIVALDQHLNILWQCDGQSQLWMNDEGVDLAGKACVAGTTIPQGAKEPQLVALLGNELILIDAQTGEQTAALAQGEPPFLACYVSKKGGIAAYRADGLLALYSPDSPGAAPNTTNDVGDYVSAAFASCDTGPFLVGFEVYGTALRVTGFDSDRVESTGTPLEASSSHGTIQGYNSANKTYLATVSDGGTCIYEAHDLSQYVTTSFQQMAKLDVSDPLSNVGICPSGVGDIFLVYGIAQSEAGYSRDSVVYEVSAATGEVLSETAIAEVRLWPTTKLGTEHPVEEVELADGSLALLVKDGTPRLVEIGTGEVLASFEHSAQAANAFADVSAFHAPNQVIALAEGTLEVFDSTSGQPAESILSAYKPYGGRRSSLAFNEDHTRLAMLCTDGAVRLFDLAANLLVWETEPRFGPYVHHLALASASSDVLLQSRSGTLTLLSAVDGSAATAYGSLPAIDANWDLDDPTLLAVHCDASKGLFVTGEAVALISLDPEALGPISVINRGRWLSRDGEQALTQLGSDYFVVHHYTLDELMETAAEAVEGHELTDEERIAYHVGS